MTKSKNVPRGTILTERLRPIMGTSPKPHYNHNLDLTPLVNKRLFGVAYGVIDRPQASLFSLHEDPREARNIVHGLRGKGFLAEVITFELPAYYRNK